MKKSLPILIGFLVLALSLSSQSAFDILDENDNVISGQTLTAYGSTTDSQVTFPFKIRNNTGNSISAVMGKEYVDIVEGSETMFCIPSGTCLLPATFTSSPFDMGAYEISDVCYVYFLPEGNPGTSLISQKVYVAGDPSNKAEIFIEFIITEPTDIALNKASKEFNIFPNPAKDFFYVSTPATANKAVLEIYNVIGKTVENIKISRSSEKLMIDCSKWESGVYFARMIIDDKVLNTIRLIVR